jgi:hypothetical protein
MKEPSGKAFQVTKLQNIQISLKWRWRRFVLSPFPISMSQKLNDHWNRLRTRHPRTYLGKLHYKMARDRRPLLTTFADKLEVKKYALSKIGTERLPLVYSEATSFSVLDWSDVPEEFVLKVNHASGGVVVVSRAADRTWRLPVPGRKAWWKKILVHPDSLDRNTLGAWVERWLGIRYHWERGDFREWAYADVKPKVFLEEYLGGEDGLAQNLKLHCMGGQVVSFLVSGFDRRFDEEAIGKFFPSELSDVADLMGLPEEEVELICELSHKLSHETDYVRVDWLLTPRGVIFGELTNYPAGGLFGASARGSLSARDVDRFYEPLWELPRDYQNLPQGSYPFQVRPE